MQRRLSLHRATFVGFATVAYLAIATQQPALVNADTIPVLSTREEVRIGNADDPNVGFNTIQVVDVDRDSQVFVYESQVREIRVYSRDGRLARRIGRAGSGPGEFGRWVRAMGVIGDSVWTFDNVDRTLNVFRRDGALVSSKKLAQASVFVAVQDGGAGMIAPMYLRSDGRFVSQLDYTLAGSDPMSQRMYAARGVTARIGAKDTVMVPRVTFPVDGGTVDTIGWEPVLPPESVTAQPPAPAGRGGDGTITIGTTRYGVPRAPSVPSIRLSFHEGSAAIVAPRPTAAQRATFDVARFDMAGKVVRRIRFEYQPGRYSARMLDTFAMREVMRRGPENPAAFRAVRAAMAYPEFQAPIYTAFAANDGSLWMRREENLSPRHRWIVVEPNGTVRGVVEIPRSAVPVWARGELAYAIDSDADGIPWLVRYRVVRGN